MLTRFVRAWIIHNTAALLAAYVLCTPIAHGITGGHASRELSVSQLAAHSIALSIVRSTCGHRSAACATTGCGVVYLPAGQPAKARLTK